jgi:ubiquinone/menaquinone biosynthesis C-methylase UbiE
MSIIIRQPQLYRFLSCCNQSDLEKVVLDCGAGGECPPLALFAQHGYQTYGIEICDSQIQKANEFADKHGLTLNISKGDMRKLQFEDESIGFVYSYNSIFHMHKSDIIKSINEIKRVLKPGGLCCLNFLSKDDGDYGKGRKAGEDEFWQVEHGGEVIHAYYDIDEAENSFDGMEILFKENRLLERIYEGEKIKQGYIDYIIRKK